ncbi:hypothetical protein PIB30_002568, partial [Stylosanthes scabra]|nr:hypothetical protein [Stylosanthes scabra]
DELSGVTREARGPSGEGPNLNDPEVAKTKGAPLKGKKYSKKRKCKRCNLTGHNMRRY